MITIRRHKFKFPFFLAGRRSAMAALAQTRASDLNSCIDLLRSRQTPTLTASGSCAAAPSTNPLNRVCCARLPHLRRSNPHS